MTKNITLIYLFITGICFSQTPSIQWSKCLGGTYTDAGMSLCPTADGGYIISASTNSIDVDVTGFHGPTFSDFWIVKTDASAEIEWEHAFGGLHIDQPENVIPCPDGGYIAVGSTLSNSHDVSGNHGGSDCWVVKLSATGTLEWQRTLGGSGGESGYDVCALADGTFLVLSATSSSDGNVEGTPTGTDAWLVKLSATGEILSQDFFGGSSGDVLYKILPTQDGGFIMAGVANSTDGQVTQNVGNGIWLVKIDADLTIEWDKCFCTAEHTESFTDIAVCPDGGYFINGVIDGAQLSLKNYWVIKTDADGNQQWQKTLGGSNEEWYGRGIPLSDGGYAVGITTNSNNGDVTGAHGHYDHWLVRLDASGNMMWQKAFGGSVMDTARGLHQAQDGGLVLFGKTASINGDIVDNTGNEDVWMIKLMPEQLGVATTENQELVVYPNPATDVVSLRIPNGLSVDKVLIYEINAKTKLEKVVTNEQVDVRDLSAGVYFIEIESGEKNYITKFIKR